MSFIQDRNRVYRTANEEEISNFLTYHSITIPFVTDYDSSKSLWTSVYSAILTIVLPLEELPWHEPDQYQTYSWESMAFRADHVLRIWRVKPIPQLGRFEYRGVTYRLPREMYCAVLDFKVA